MAERSVGILVQAHDQATRELTRIGRGVESFQKHVDRIPGQFLTRFASVSAVLLALDRASATTFGNLANHLEQTARDGSTVSDVFRSMSEEFQRESWTALAPAVSSTAESYRDLAMSVPIAGHAYRAFLMMLPGEREALQLREFAKALEETMPQRADQAVKAAAAQRAAFDDLLRSQFRRALGEAHTAEERATIEHQMRLFEIETDFANRRRQVVANIPHGHQRDVILGAVGQMENNERAGAARSAEDQRIQRELDLGRAIMAADDRTAEARSELREDHFRAEGRMLDADLARIDRHFDERIRLARDAARAEAERFGAEDRDVIIERAEKLADVLREQRDLTKDMARDEATRQQADTALSREDAKRRERMEFLREEINLGNEAAKIDLDRLRVIDNFERRERSLLALLEQQNLTAEERLEIERKIEALREQRERSLGNVGQTRRDSPAQPEPWRAYEARFLTRPPGRSGHFDHKINENTAKTAKVAERQIVKTDELIRAVERGFDNSIVLRPSNITGIG